MYFTREIYEKEIVNKMRKRTMYERDRDETQCLSVLKLVVWIPFWNQLTLLISHH